MKKSTKILLCLAAVFLSAGTLLTVVGIAAGVRPIQAFRDGTMDFVLSEKRSSPFSPDGRYIVPADTVQKLDIDWVDGEIVIEPYDGTDILLEETCAAALSESTALDYTQNGDTLKIQVAPGRVGVQFSALPRTEKQLHICLPRNVNWEAVSVDAASAQVRMQDTAVKTISMDQVTGDVSLQGVTAERLELDSLKGNLKVKDTRIATVEMDTVDGSLEGAFAACPQDIHFDSMHGNIELTLPSDSEFVVKIDSISAKLDCAFAGTYREDGYTVGDGKAKFEIDTISGMVQIRKAAPAEKP